MRVRFKCTTLSVESQKNSSEESIELPWWCWFRGGLWRGGAQEDARDGRKLEEILQNMQAAEAAPICQHLVRELFTNPRQAAAAAS